MSLARVLACSLCGAGLLLAAATPFAPDDLTVIPDLPHATGADKTNRPEESFSACIDTPSCIDGYLWSLYQRTPKLDGGADFTWKDAAAAEQAGMSPMNYVIGGMDPWFRVTLYRALRTLDAAGFSPGIMCAFRDDYRQSITTSRMKAQNDRSYHGGSFRGGYGHGVAADIISLKGPNVTERMLSWIDGHEKELGIGRPYLKHDPPHVAPLDGEEYAAHRLPGAKARSRLPIAAPGGETGTALSPPAGARQGSVAIHGAGRVGFGKSSDQPN